MDMWNWLIDCYKEKSLTLQDLEKVMADKEEARRLWEDYSADSYDFINWVQDEVRPFINYIKKMKNER